MPDGTLDRFRTGLLLRRRNVLGVLAVGMSMGAFGTATVAAGQEGDGSDGEIHPVFGFTAESEEVEPPVEPDHEVMLMEEAREQADVPFPEWHFDPVGLSVEPGETVRFSLQSPFHTVSAFHPNLGYNRRVPDTVGPISSPVLWPDASFMYRFDEPGVYGLLCLPHGWTGMVIRIVAGEATGPGADPPPEQRFHEEEPFPDPADPMDPEWLGAAVLRDPALDPETVIEQGSVEWAEIAAESKEFPSELLMAPGGETSLAAALSGIEARVDTDAAGCAHFVQMHGRFLFDVVVEHLEAVTQAHIHEGSRGEDGPVVAPLFEYTGDPDGTGEGEPRDATPDAPLFESGTVEDPELVEAIVAAPSEYYVNVHTIENPGGEIPGQLRMREGDTESTDGHDIRGR